MTLNDKFTFNIKKTKNIIKYRVVGKKHIQHKNDTCNKRR